MQIKIYPQNQVGCSMKVICVISLFLFVFLFMSCERKTVIEVEGGNPPKFRIDGSGGMLQMFVFGPYKFDEVMTQSGNLETRLLWQIAPGGAFSQNTLTNLPEVVYGTIPDGCKQIFPEGSIPKELEEGSFYTLSVPTNYAPSGFVIFQIKEGKAKKIARNKD